MTGNSRGSGTITMIGGMHSIVHGEVQQLSVRSSAAASGWCKRRQRRPGSQLYVRTYQRMTSPSVDRHWARDHLGVHLRLSCLTDRPCSSDLRWLSPCAAQMTFGADRRSGASGWPFVYIYCTDIPLDDRQNPSHHITQKRIRLPCLPTTPPLCSLPSRTRVT